MRTGSPTKNVLLLMVVASLTWGASEQDGASELLDADRAFCADTAERGLEGWLEWFAPDADVFTPRGEAHSGADELRAYYESIAFPPPGFSWSPASGELAESGELGYTIGSWEQRSPGVPPEAEVPGGRYLTIWKLQPDGSFRVVTDAGGRPDFRTRLEGLDGPPLEWSSTTERFELAESGELAFASGTWTARTAKSALEGRLLTVWKRTGEGVWEIATEIGFDH